MESSAGSQERRYKKIVSEEVSVDALSTGLHPKTGNPAMTITMMFESEDNFGNEASVQINLDVKIDSDDVDELLQVFRKRGTEGVFEFIAGELEAIRE